MFEPIRNILSRYRPPVILSASVAVCLSLIFSFLIYPSLEGPYHAQQDVDRYGEIAKNLYNGEGFRFADGEIPTVSRGPIYPLLLAALSWLGGGYTVWSVQILQALLLAGACVIIFFVGRQMFSADIGRWAALAVALYPLFFWYAARVWTETVLVVCTALLAYRLARFHHAPTFGRGVMLGIVAAILALVKSSFLLFIPFLLLYYGITKNISAVRHALLALLCVVVIVLPWSVRNYHVSEKIIPIQTSAASNYLIGNVLARDYFQQPLSLSVHMQKGTELIAGWMADADLTPMDAEEAAGESVLSARVIESVLENPFFLLQKAGIQGVTFWYLGETPAKSIVLFLLQLPVVIFAVAGVRKARRNGVVVTPLLLIIFYLWVVAALFLSHARISVPVIPLMIVLAVYGLYQRR